MIDDFPLALPDVAGLIFFGVWLIFCVWLWFARNFTCLVGALATAGVFQAVLLGLTGHASFQYLDDLAALLVILAAVLVAAKRSRPGLLVLGVLLVLVVLATARADALAAGVAQARQVLLPAGLAFSGYVLRYRIRWPALMRYVAVLTAFVVAWMLVEAARQAPLLDPLAGVQLQLGRPLTDLRLGLPQPYWTDGVLEGRPWFRPGGPFFNPPTAGFFLASGALAILSLRNRAARLTGLVAVAFVLGLSFARAGVLIFACITVAYWAWRTVGRTLTVVGMTLLALVLFEPIARQGNTASHAEGLIDGLVLGMRTGVGAGFGAFGFQAETSDAGVSESLLGLYFGWMGVPAVLLVGWVAVRLTKTLLRTRGHDARLALFALGVLAAAAVSETASALSGTSVCWLVVGLCLAPDGRLNVANPLSGTAAASLRLYGSTATEARAGRPAAVAAL